MNHGQSTTKVATAIDRDLPAFRAQFLLFSSLDRSAEPLNRSRK